MGLTGGRDPLDLLEHAPARYAPPAGATTDRWSEIGRYRFAHLSRGYPPRRMAGSHVCPDVQGEHGVGCRCFPC